MIERFLPAIRSRNVLNQQASVVPNLDRHPCSKRPLPSVLVACPDVRHQLVRKLPVGLQR